MNATREERLKSAKQKLKQYRAKQAKSQLCQSSSCLDALDSPKRTSFPVHGHKRSLSRRHSRTESVSRRASLRLSVDVSPPPVVVEQAARASHSRRPSRHSRQLSIGTRRESMDIMSGLIASGSIISNPSFLQGGGSPDLLLAEARSPGPSFPFSSPKTPHSAPMSTEETHTARRDALDTLEGRSPPRALGEFPPPTSVVDSPLSNKRASWGSAASAMAWQGGKGAVDLGMLVEEDEEEEGSPTATKGPSLPMTSPTAHRVTRQRPTSLRLSRHASLGSAVNVPSPLDLSSTFSPDTANTTPNSSLSFKLLRTNTPFAQDAFQSSALKKQYHRQSGLKSLTLSSPSVDHMTSTPPNSTPQRRRSQGSTSSVSASKRRPVSVSGSVSAGRRMSYRAATPEDYVFGRLVMDDEYGADESRSFEHSHEPSETSLAQSEVSSLKIQIEALQSEAASLRSELSASKYQLEQLRSERRTNDESRAMHYKLFEVEGQLEAKRSELKGEQEARKLDVERHQVELGELQERLADVECERDELQEDIGGWRTRCANLEKAVVVERTAKEEERKQSLIAREKVRKLGDQLAARSSGSNAPLPTADVALANAQAKLIGEMRDQIFSMAAALDAEKKQREADAVLIEQLRSQLALQDSVQSRVHTDSDASASMYSKSMSTSSVSSNDTSYTTDVPSPKKADSSSASVPLGSLHAVAEEDEENLSASDLEPNPVVDEESEWLDDQDDVPELDFRGTQTQAQAEARLKVQSTSSSILDDMPSTPSRTSPIPSPEPSPEKAPRGRSDSFIRQWTFPRGPVPLQVVQPDDHSFFSISTTEVLPPLPVSETALDLPEFFTSDLVIDEEVVRDSLEVQRQPEHIRRPSSPRPTSQRFSPMRISMSSTTGRPPAARSARWSTAFNESQSSFMTMARAPSRMSLQGISSLITAYVAPQQAVVPKMAHAAATLCTTHSREESIFADDDRALLRPLSIVSNAGKMSLSLREQQQRNQRPLTPTKPPRTLLKSEHPRPFASPLRLLDFIASFGLRPEQVLQI